jgi:hypothetical protein
MPGPFTPADDYVTPIVHEIALLIQAQIPSVTTVYETLPDQPAQDNSVVLPLVGAKVLGDTNGKLKIALNFGMRHVFRRTNISEAISRAYSYVMPWMNFLSAWNNQTLNGLAIEVSAKALQITQHTEAGIPMIALVITFEVLTEFNIPLD